MCVAEAEPLKPVTRKVVLVALAVAACGGTLRSGKEAGQSASTRY